MLAKLGERGFRKLDNELPDFPSWGNANAMQLYIHCLFRANTESRKIGDSLLLPGQFITSTARMAAECGLTEKECRGAFDRLIKDELLDVKRAGKGPKSGVIVTVANSRFFGFSDPKEGGQTGNIRKLMGTNPGDRIRVRDKDKEKEKEVIEINGGSSSGYNGGHSREPPPPKESIPVNLKDCMNDIRSQYGDEVAKETWQRVLDNSPPGDVKRMTPAYLRSTAAGIAEDQRKEEQREQIESIRKENGGHRYDDQGREILDEY